MDPRYWGRSFWIVIFIIITKFKHDIETCKRHLYNICKALPCAECKDHALQAIQKNNIMSSNDINYIYFFFISLYNNLVFNPERCIDIKKVKKLI
ncbi:redox protein E10R orthologue [Fowlpox virus isolate HP-438/Munich]|uniref:Sulfhydryl oxidase n=1 Tax=Fowlpox virus TaxID=10261 RepID=Q70H61_FOWPV|nr:sulfhydryl oxidase [Fowlpox virus]URH28477.1 sulfhydryl oxidase [Fowlpox virus]URH28736.1 sulfhydryl oxidase [Fowlpox virus]CAE52635.1 redox protein E10R orthologue [Fowlpox virus isolate HP-438/Munich]